MRLDLERDDIAVADIDDAGVLFARFDEHALAVLRQELQDIL
jgi:hypothetical protein